MPKPRRPTTLARCTPRGRPGRRAVAALLAALSLAACPRPAPGAVAGCDRASTRDQVFVGLYSIFYRAAQAAAPNRVRGWKPAPLPTAAGYLRCDPDRDRRPGRLRRAAIKLAAGLVLLERQSRDRALVKEFRAALAVLGVETLEKKLLAVQRTRRASVPAGTDLSGLEDQAGKIIDSDPAFAELQRSCCGCIESCQVGPSAGVSIAEFEIGVNRDAPCLFHVIDPQCWPGVVPTNFKQTFVLDGAQCVQGNPVCRSTSPCDGSLGAPQPKPGTPTPGAPWCGLLFEDATGAAFGITSEFKNVLKVKTSGDATDPTAYRMDYGLCESREWTICDPQCQSGSCALDRDCGYALVKGTSVAGTAHLFGTKRVKFKPGLPDDPNAWAPIALEVMVSETAISACVPASACPAAAAQPGCPATTTTTIAGQQGSTAATGGCTCAKDHCDQEYSLTPQFTAPMCP